MRLYNCIVAAEGDIDNARRHLETGSAISWICDEIYSAIMWAMEAWIIGKGHEPNKGNGWYSVRAQFYQLAPTEIRELALYCIMQAGALDYDKTIPFEKWKKMVFEVIDKAEQCIITIETDCGCTEEQLKKLWLYGKTHKE